MKKWGRPIENVRHRFMKKVRRGANGHLIWMGAKGIDGIGKFWIKPYLQDAPRVAWVLRHGWINTGERAFPTCGNKDCVNVAHLKCEYRSRLWREVVFPRKIVLDEAKYIYDELIVARAKR